MTTITIKGFDAAIQAAKVLKLKSGETFDYLDEKGRPCVYTSAGVDNGGRGDNRFAIDYYSKRNGKRFGRIFTKKYASEADMIHGHDELEAAGKLIEHVHIDLRPPTIYPSDVAAILAAQPIVLKNCDGEIRVEKSAPELTTDQKYPPCSFCGVNVGLPMAKGMKFTHLPDCQLRKV